MSTYNAAGIYTRSQMYLLNVSIEAEEVKDAGAVHLGWMKATDHGHGAGGVASVRGGRLRQRVRHHVGDVH